MNEQQARERGYTFRMDDRYDVDVREAIQRALNDAGQAVKAALDAAGHTGEHSFPTTTGWGWQSDGDWPQVKVEVRTQDETEIPPRCRNPQKTGAWFSGVFYRVAYTATDWVPFTTAEEVLAEVLRHRDAEVAARERTRRLEAEHEERLKALGEALREVAARFGSLGAAHYTSPPSEVLPASVRDSFKTADSDRTPDIHVEVPGDYGPSDPQNEQVVVGRGILLHVHPWKTGCQMLLEWWTCFDRAYGWGAEATRFQREYRTTDRLPSWGSTDDYWWTATPGWYARSLLVGEALVKDLDAALRQRGWCLGRHNHVVRVEEVKS